MKVCRICSCSSEEVSFAENDLCIYCNTAKKGLEETSKKACSCNLNNVDYIASKNDILEVTEWSNGEGVDVYIYEEKSTPKEKHYSFSIGELEALVSCCSKIGYELINYNK